MAAGSRRLCKMQDDSMGTSWRLDRNQAIDSIVLVGSGASAEGRVGCGGWGGSSLVASGLEVPRHVAAEGAENQGRTSAQIWP